MPARMRTLPIAKQGKLDEARLPEARGRGEPGGCGPADRGRAQLLRDAQRNAEAFASLRGARQGPSSRIFLYDLALTAEKLERFDLLENPPAQADRGQARSRARLQRPRLFLRRSQYALPEARKLIEKRSRSRPRTTSSWTAWAGSCTAKATLRARRASCAAPTAASRRRDRRISAKCCGCSARRTKRARIWDEALKAGPENETTEEHQAAAAVKSSYCWRCSSPAAPVEIKPPEGPLDFARRAHRRALRAESFTGNIAWRHARHGDELLISTPTRPGRGADRAPGDAVLLKTAEPREYRDADAEALTERVLGFPDPDRRPGRLGAGQAYAAARRPRLEGRIPGATTRTPPDADAAHLSGHRAAAGDQSVELKTDRLVSSAGQAQPLPPCPRAPRGRYHELQTAFG